MNDTNIANSVTHRTQRARQRANDYLAQGRMAEASVVLQSLLRTCPEDGEARLQLARLQLDVDAYRDAHALVRGVPLERTTVAAHLGALRAFTEHGRMVALADAVGDPADLPLAALADGGHDLAAVGATEHATRWLGQARQLAPDDPAVLVRSAMLALDLGETHDAEAWLEQAIARHDTPVAHWLLAGARTWTSERHHVDRLRARLALANASRDRAHLAFALHKELDDLGEIAAAWHALTLARQAWRSTIAYRTEDADTLFDRLMTWSLPTDSCSEASDGPTPIFIVGLHRSGTTLLERMLGAHPEVALGGESMRFTAQLREAADHHCRDVVDPVIVDRAGTFDWHTIGRGFVEASQWFAADHRWFTEKHPANVLTLPFIRRALPHARIVHVRRDPMQVGWSMLRELFAGTCAYSYDMAELGHWIGRQQRLVRGWLAHGDPAVLEIDYADLVLDPDATARRVYAHCGLDWRDDACAVERRSGRIATASATQAREAVHTRSLDRWRPYAAYLEPLQAALAAHGV